MLEAVPATVRFCCPACGAALRGSRADAGTVQGCRRCGEAIRVPRRQHPVECDLPDPPAVAPLALAAARGGLRLLRLGHALVVAQGALVLGAYFLWSALEGTASVLARSPGPWRTLLLSLWAADLALLAAQSGVKWLGYQRCEAAAAAVDAGGWLTLARFAVLLRGVGYLMSCAPWLTAPADAEAWPVRACAQFGHVAWTAGLLFEFGVLVVWHRLLVEVAGGLVAAEVARFTAWAVGLTLTAAAAVSLTSMTLIILLRRAGPPATPAQGVRLDFAAVPLEGWAAVGGLVGLLMAFALLVALRYGLMLRGLGRALAFRPV